MVIGVDIDGVLADFNTAYINLVPQLTGRNLFPEGYTKEDITTWSYPETFGYTKEEITRVWDWIANDARFWYNLGALEGAQSFGTWTNSLRPLNEVYFITSRVGAAVQLQTIAWLINRLGVEAPTVLISSEKGMCCKALKVNYYIDDKNENCTQVLQDSPKTLCYMLARPWNSLEAVTVSGNIIRVDNLLEFQEAIDGKQARV